MTHGDKPVSTKAFLATALAALGVVYGDIGTSPLYALKESFLGPHAVPATRENVLGVLSLIVWALILVVTVKYLTFVMRADNHGEGGILALMALTGRRARRTAGSSCPSPSSSGSRAPRCSTATASSRPPSRSSRRVEGLKVATPVFEPFVVPITVVILVALFLVQRRGTATGGRRLRPGHAALVRRRSPPLGVYGIVGEPAACSRRSAPTTPSRSSPRNGWHGFLVLGAVVLVRHRRRGALRRHGALRREADPRSPGSRSSCPRSSSTTSGRGRSSSRDPDAVAQLFFNTAPGWALYPLVVIATAGDGRRLAGAHLGGLLAHPPGHPARLLPAPARSATPRRETIGQIYLPEVNWALMVGCVALVLGFRSSSRLAAAYGIAVTGTMIITTLLFHRVARDRWRWSLAGGRPPSPGSSSSSTSPSSARTSSRSRTAAGSRS